MNKDKFTCFRLTYEIGKSIQDKEMRLKFYDALMEYAFDWIKTNDPNLIPLLVWPIYSIDKSNKIYEAQSEKWKLHKWNQYTVWDWKRKPSQKAINNPVEQNGTKWNKLEQNGTDIRSNISSNISSSSNRISLVSLENRVIGEGEKKKKTPTPTPSLVQEYLEAYETSPLKELVGNDEGAIKEWLVYKQNKKEMYASSKTFLQTLKWYINLVNPNWVRLPDIWSRLAFAIRLAIDNKRKWLFREEKQKQLYEGSKKIDLVINRKQWEI